MTANKKAGLAAILAAAPIRFYARFITPLTPPVCRFVPSCSIYTMDAIAEHGALKGLALGLRRLARCHPVTWLGGSSGFDPVPHTHSCKSNRP